MNVDKEYWTEEMEKGFLRCWIPERMQGGLLRYVLEGIPPGGFLTAVLSNDLMEACGRAEEDNRRLLFRYCQFIHNHTPGMCKGSPLRFKEWIAEHAKRREENVTA